MLLSSPLSAPASLLVPSHFRQKAFLHRAKIDEKSKNGKHPLKTFASTPFFLSTYTQSVNF